uniref:Uncharacterized protein n=1 Tax=Triticum urartu TaxID=4572 RepID=A0A8R7TH62_TRIUA
MVVRTSHFWSPLQEALLLNSILMDRGQLACLVHSLHPAINSLQVMPELIVCLPWIPCSRVRISVPVIVPAKWSSLFRC